MSRVGNQPIKLPAGVSVDQAGQVVKVTGPQGELNLNLLPSIDVSVQDGQVIVSRKDDLAISRARHGLIRSLLNNMVEGVSRGFAKKLEINGVGYRVQSQGQALKFNLGYSHDVDYQVPAGIAAAVDQNIITISGADKQQVGQVAAEIRALRKPEPYKGKGIKYEDETILRKSGKSGKEGAGV